MAFRCEMAAKSIIPVARALIAKKLVDAYGFSQTVAAKKMGISQPAICQYRKNIRGRGAESFEANGRFMEIVNEIAKKVAEGSVTPERIDREMCRLCRLMQPEEAS